jgi:hypothetical protein
MSDDGLNPRSRLELRAGGGARVDGVRRARIEALERRAATQTGAVRQLLDARLSELRAALADETAPAAKPVDTGERTHPRSALKGLIQQFERHEATHHANGDVTPNGMHIAVSGRAQHAAFDDIRQACAEVRTRTQLRQALASAPADAGPLNSASLVHRALARMHALSPEYLQHFLVYVDAVSALQPLCGSAVKPAESAPRHAGAGKRSRTKPRSPQA